jgi:hypothetical protein
VYMYTCMHLHTYTAITESTVYATIHTANTCYTNYDINITFEHITASPM